MAKIQAEPGGRRPQPLAPHRPQPDFLCIGAPKCGTTWLYKRLAAHPQIWLPPVKELRYFNKRFPPPRQELPPSRRMGLLGLFAHYPRRIILRTLRRMLSPSSGFPVAWTLKYLSGPGDFDWYASLFRPGRGRVTGDITPFYASLDEQAVAAIAAHFGHLRVIFLMRDPIERAWSNARMMLPLMLDRPASSLTEQDFLDYLGTDTAHAHSDYLHTLDTWGRHFPTDQFFVACYERIAEDPQGLLNDVTALLQVEPVSLPDAALQERVNAGRHPAYSRIPAAAQMLCATRYAPMLERLASRVGPGPVTVWRDRARAALDTADAGGT